MRGIIGLVAMLLASCSGKPTPPTGPGSGSGSGSAVIANDVDAGPVAGDTQCTGEPPSPDYVCVQDCGEPVVRQGDPPPGWSWLSPDLAENRRKYGCPICLPPDARIATPDGDVAVADLTAGDSVVTLDDSGARIDGRVVLVRSTLVGDGHVMTRVTLSDGRVVTASARHPVADGRAIGTLRAGDTVGDTRITAVDTVPFAGDHTWDLVVSGPTGLYLADGVVMQSTIDQR